MYVEIEKCRVCGNEHLVSVLSLGDQSLTGVFPSSTNTKVFTGPVELVRCDPGLSGTACGLVQLKQSYDVSEMYGLNYGYRSGLNAGMVEHLHSKVDKILGLGVLERGDLIIDVGSNDATTLKRYPRDCYSLVGIDPTGIKFASYYPPEIRLIPEFFSADAVKKATNGAKAKVITAFSMFYDLDDPISFAREVAGALDDNGIWIFEQSYMPEMLRKNSFDTICHEHLDFYGLLQIDWILKAAGLKIIDVEFNDVNGGSFSVTAALKSSSRPQNTELIEKVLDKERALALDSSVPYDAFKSRISLEKNKLMQFLQNARKNGEKVSGLGASTKGNVLLQYYGITSDLVNQIGEVNEDKFGAFTPGTLIPLVPESDILADDPDYILILPWHFRDFFMGLSVLKGRKLVFPLPQFEIVEVT